MEYFLLVDNQQTGPYSFDEILTRLRSNQISGSTLAWSEGMADWTPVIDVVTQGQPTSQTPQQGEATQIRGNGLRHAPKERKKRKLNKDLAICALIFGIIGAWIFPLAIPAVICGHLALPKISKHPGKYGGRGMALWGVWLGWIGIFFGVVALAVRLSLHSTISEGLSDYDAPTTNRETVESTAQTNVKTEKVQTEPSEVDWKEIRQRLRNFNAEALPEVRAGQLSAEDAASQQERLIEMLSRKYDVTVEDLQAEAARIGRQAILTREPPKKPLPETGERFLSSSLFQLSFPTDGGRRGDDRAPLRISVPDEGQHYYIKIVNRSDREWADYLFIRSGDSFEIEIPLGSYEIVYAVGETWRGNIGPNAYFGKSTEFFKCEDVFTFRREGNDLVGYEIELLRQLNGNLDTERIAQEEF